MHPHWGQPMSQQRGPCPSASSQQGWLGEQAGPSWQGLPVSCHQGMNGQPAHTSLPHSAHNLSSLLFFLFFSITQIWGREICWGGFCVRSHLKLLNLWYHNQVLYNVYLKKKIYMFNKTQIFVSCIELREWLRESILLKFLLSRSHSHCLAPVQSCVNPAGEKPHGKSLNPQERKLPLSTHPFPQDTRKHLT